MTTKLQKHDKQMTTKLQKKNAQKNTKKNDTAKQE